MAGRCLFTKLFSLSYANQSPPRCLFSNVKKNVTSVLSDIVVTGLMWHSFWQKYASQHSVNT